MGVCVHLNGYVTCYNTENHEYIPVFQVTDSVIYSGAFIVSFCPICTHTHKSSLVETVSLLLSVAVAQIAKPFHTEWWFLVIIALTGVIVILVIITLLCLLARRNKAGSK